MSQQTRAPRSGTKQKNKRPKLTIRPKPDELELLHRRARSFGYKSLSKYLIERGLREGVMIQSADREKLERLLFEVRKIGWQISQIARRMSKDNATYSQAELDRVMRQAERALGEVAGEIER